MIELSLKLISDSPTRVIFLPNARLEDIHSLIFDRCKWTSDNYYLSSNGHGINNTNELNGIIQVIPKLRGGKGGFGSMLRAIGAQIEKTTNREACRDLSGRRLRDINEEQRLKKWISQQAEREREIEEKRKKKLEKLSAEPKHEFVDQAYFTERSELTEKLSDSVEEGIKASTSSLKRKVKEDKPVKKKIKLLMDIGEFSSSDSEGKEDDSFSEDCCISQINDGNVLPSEEDIKTELESSEESGNAVEKKIVY